MLRRVVQLPLRRCMHTTPPRPPHRIGLRIAIGASVVAAAYLTWRTSETRRISLDVQESVKASKLERASGAPAASSDARLEEKLQDHANKPEPTLFEPDTTPTSDTVLPEPSPSGESSNTETPISPPSGEQDSSTTTEAQPEDATTAEGDTANGGAFNPETGEINWDCPCLGGMAHGPCGPQFREAFSCFVFSEQEPKGVDCIEKFKAMQDCFREHPEIYAEEIMRDEEDEKPVNSEDGVGPIEGSSQPDENPTDENPKDPTITTEEVDSARPQSS